MALSGPAVDFYAFVQCLAGRGLSQFPRLTGVGLQTIASRAYRWSARNRTDRPHVIFQYTLSGRGVFRDGRGAHPVPPGAAFLCLSHDPRIAYYYPADAAEPWRFVFVTFVGATAHRLARDLIRRFGGLYRLPPDHPALAPLFAFRVHHGINCVLPPSEGARLVTDLLLALLRSMEAATVDQPDHRLVAEAHEEIRSRLADRVTVGDIATRLTVSRGHLARVFRRETGETPRQYIVRLKMQAACSLLTAGSLTVKEVSARLGFPSVAEFCRAFKTHLHVTPGAFRSRLLAPSPCRVRPPPGYRLHVNSTFCLWTVPRQSATVSPSEEGTGPEGAR